MCVTKRQISISIEKRQVSINRLTKKASIYKSINKNLSIDENLSSDKSRKKSRNFASLISIDYITRTNNIKKKHKRRYIYINATTLGRTQKGGMQRSKKIKNSPLWKSADVMITNLRIKKI